MKKLKIALIALMSMFAFNSFSQTDSLVVGLVVSDQDTVYVNVKSPVNVMDSNSKVEEVQYDNYVVAPSIVVLFLIIFTISFIGLVFVLINYYKNNI